MGYFKVFTPLTGRCRRVATVDQAIELAQQGDIVLHWDKVTREWLEV